MKLLRIIFLVILGLAIGAAAYAAEPAATATDPNALKTPDVKVSIKVEDKATSDVLASIASQSKQKILVESTVKGKVTLSVSDVSVEAALSAVCKPGRLVWRKLYIDPKSELLDKPDRLAATLRLISGLSFPDVVVADSSTNKASIYCQQKPAVAATQDKVVKELGMQPVYIVTNDAAVAAKEAEKNTAVNKYVNSTKELMDQFMKMTPEEREQVLAESLGLMDSVGPEYMNAVMQTLVNGNPDALRRMVSRQTDFMFSMPTEQRRAMIKLNMESMTQLTPEQQRIIQEDAKAVMEEIKNQGNAPVPGQ